MIISYITSTDSTNTFIRLTRNISTFTAKLLHDREFFSSCQIRHLFSGSVVNKGSTDKPAFKTIHLQVRVGFQEQTWLGLNELQQPGKYE